MDKTLFLTCYQFTKKHPKLEKYILFTGKILPQLMLFVYFGFLFLLIQTKSSFLIKAVAVPFFTLILITMIRKTINRKRPFEIFPIVCTLSHDKGNSFPSRHTASAFIIAITILHYHFAYGLFFLFIAFIIAISRVMLGLHFPLDVLVGAAISGVIGYFGFFFN